MLKPCQAEEGNLGLKGRRGMSGTNEPSLANSLITIHKVITRAIEVTKDRSQSFVQHGLSDVSLRSGFVSYLRAFVSVTHAHHLTEDEVFFPYFREKIPEAPFDLLTAQHREVARLLDEIGAATDAAESGSQSVEPFSSISRVATGLGEIWYPHIAKEESLLSPAGIDAIVARDEQLGLIKLATEHSMKHAGPDYLVVPFMLYNLSPEDRATMSQGMPPVVTQQLVPVAWKEKWAPMSPFLLD
jgi:hemerythrin-like domain-containing protein